MTAQGVSLRVTAVVDRDCRLSFQRPGEPALTVRSELSANQLADLRSRVGEALDEFRSRMALVPQTAVEPVARALQDLHRHGRYLLRILFGRDDNALAQIQAASEMCARACPLWETPGWEPGALRASLVEVESPPQDGLILDMLPLLHPAPPPDAVTLPDVGRLASSFLGFSAIVQRGRQPATGRRLHNLSGLPVCMVWHGKTPFAAQARDLFRRQPSFELAQTWPETRRVAGPAAALARLLWRHGDEADGTLRARPIEIHHFHCHCDTKAPSPSDYALRLKSDLFLSWEQRIRLDDLFGEIDDLRSQDLDDRAPRPLVFLNACGSAKVDPRGIGSFPERFRVGFTGFIGTDATVPDAFAFHFARYFYDHLLSGDGVGEALYRARWSMLKSYKNPLGILYGLYADPDIRVRRPVPLEQVRTTTTGA